MSDSPATITTTTEIAIAVVEYRGTFLIGLRPPSAPLAGLWEFPGGKIRPGESPAEAAARECLEETGLVVEVGEAYSTVTQAYDHGSVRLHFVRCRLVNSDDAAKAPDQMRWAPARELVDYQFPAGNAGLIELLSRGSV